MGLSGPELCERPDGFFWFLVGMESLHAKATAEQQRAEQLRRQRPARR